MSDDPVPAYFSIRYIIWLAWSNSITGLMTLQAIFATLTLDPQLLSHSASHYVLIGNAVLCAVVAQVKRNNPPGPPPTKDVQ